MSSSMISKTASEEEMKEVAARICRDYLHGVWKTITADDIKFRRISGGLSNFLYYVSLPDSYDNNNSSPPECYKRIRKDGAKIEREPKEVLLRIYGQSHGETAMLTELVVFTLLSERKLGPRLHGIFPGGRIEEYIPARALNNGELSNQCISMKIAEKMSQIHALNIPVSKEPEWIWKTMGRWLKNVESIFASTKYDILSHQNSVINEIRKTDLNKEVTWLKTVIESSNYPVLFCHNDLQEGNILIKGQPPSYENFEHMQSSQCDATSGHQNGMIRAEIGDRYVNNLSNGNVRHNSTREINDNNHNHTVNHNNNNSTTEDIRRLNIDDSTCDAELIIIDYEYCAYNYRGFDIANHFIEWTFDYTKKEFPYFDHRKKQYPTQEQRDAFIVQYLRTWKNWKNYTPSKDELNDIIEEIHCFTMASHLFWTLWSIINVHQVIEFGYWEYALCRLQEYLDQKEEYIRLYLDKTIDIK